MSSIAFLKFSIEKGIGSFRWLDFVNWDSVLGSRVFMGVVLLGTEWLSSTLTGCDELSHSDANNAIQNKALFLLRTGW